MVLCTIKGLAPHIRKGSNTIKIKRKDYNHNENSLKLLEERMKMKFPTTCNLNSLQASPWLGLIKLFFTSDRNPSSLPQISPKKSSKKLNFRVLLCRYRASARLCFGVCRTHVNLWPHSGFTLNENLHPAICTAKEHIHA